MTPADEQLLADWRAGDPLAGKALFERHHAGVQRFFVSKLGARESDDLTQATFLAVHEGWAERLRRECDGGDGNED